MRASLLGAILMFLGGALLLLTSTMIARSDPIYCYASYYWQDQKTATGERFKPEGITCAHKTIRFGTTLRVTNIRNGRSTTCRVNDRGPYIAKRCIDLSRGAARQVGMITAGVVPVKIEIVGR